MTSDRAPGLPGASTAKPNGHALRRIAIFTGDLSAFSVRWGVAELIDRFPDVTWLLVEHRLPRSLHTIVAGKWRRVRREGPRAIFDITFETMRSLAAFVLPSAEEVRGAPGAHYKLARILDRPGVSLLRPGDIHGTDALAAIRRFDPDLGISVAAPILRPELFELPRQGTINLHKGKLPLFRGMPPAFWEIWTRAREVGCSIHRVERSLDTGPILLEQSVAVEPFSTVRGLQIALDGLGVEMMCEAVHRIAHGTATWTPQSGGGQTYRKPTAAQWAAIRRIEPGRRSCDWKCLAKEFFFWLYVTVIRPLPRAMLALLNRQRICVLLYHRVSDSMRDSVTVGVEQFERQMVDVRKRCRIVGIDDIIANRVRRSSLRPIVAITFDDGYRDNFEHAAPILLRHGVPAAFFVSTALIESDRGFPHDLKKLGRAVPAMDWKQVSSLRRWGFTVGSHTETHINCVKAEPDVVDREIVGSMRTLRQRLSSGDVIFAYPYGGRGDFNERWRARVKEAGYVGCLSAYGGCNKRAVDPFNVLRVGVNHNFRTWAFRARLEGWT